MKIKNIFEQKERVVSFEIFPPNKNFSEEKLKAVTAELVNLKPDFISVTYGAGGKTKGGTIEMASYIKNVLNTEVLAHLTCVGSKKSEIENFMKEVKENNIQNILALRGDVPKGETEEIYDRGDFKYASELIQELKSNSDISIGAAFYPETHYQNNDLVDLFHLKNKVEKGADFSFREQAEKLDINVPLVAGIMPITNAAQIKRIVELSKCSVPKKLERILEKYGDNPESMQKAGVLYATDQIIELFANDVKGIHLYTMNKVEAARDIMNNISFAR